MDNRLQKITRASAWGIGLNLALVAVKAAMGVVAGSVSILTDAVNNLTDTMSAVVALVGTKLAHRKPDREHPHGHGRIEYVAATIVGLIILSVGILAAYHSVPKIMHPEVANYSGWTIAVIFVTVVAKLVFGRYLRRVGRETRSRSLEGSGIDALFDAALSFGTLVGAAASLIWGVSIDGWVGLLIAIFIVKSAFEILSEGMTDIIGRRVDEKLARKIREAIREVEGVEGVKNLVLHDYGPGKTIGAVRIEVKESMEIRRFKKISEEICQRLMDEYGVDITVGV